MTADVSPNGVITEVRVKNKFTTAKTEFQHMSSERPAESTDTETEQEERNSDGEEEEEAEEKQEIKVEVNIKTEAEEGDMEVGNCQEAKAVTTNGTHPESNTHDGGAVNGDTGDPSIDEVPVASDLGDLDNDIILHHNSNGKHHLESDQEVSKQNSDTTSYEPVEEAVAASNKKPKLESLNDCDNTSDPAGRK